MSKRERCVVCDVYYLEAYLPPQFQALHFEIRNEAHG